MNHTPHTRLERFEHWAYHTPKDWAEDRSCGPATAIWAAITLAGFFITVPYATPILVGNIVIPFAANAVRAQRNHKRSLVTRPQMSQPPCISPGPQTPVETETYHKVPQWRIWLSRRAQERGGWVTTRVDAWFSKPSHVVDAIEDLVGAANRGSKPAKLVDDWLSERSRVPGFAAEMAMLALGAWFHVPPRLLFSMEIFFHDIPDVLAGYIGARTGEVHRVFRPGMFQRPETIRAYQERGELDSGNGPSVYVLPDTTSADTPERSEFRATNVHGHVWHRHSRTYSPQLEAVSAQATVVEQGALPPEGGVGL